mgnify:CR=1 FL=1
MAEETAADGVVAEEAVELELLALKLSPDAITPDDPELLEDLVIAAVNEASRKVDDELMPSPAYRLFFWLSVLSIGVMAVWALYSTLAP